MTAGRTRTEWWRAPLPGELGRARVWHRTDLEGRPLALVEHPSTGRWTVVLAAEPDAAALTSDAAHAVRASRWRRWLAGLGPGYGIDQVAVVLDHGPDPGSRLMTAVESGLERGAPTVARAVLLDVAERLPQGACENTAHVAVTFPGQRSAADVTAARIAAALPELSRSLAAAGAGETRPLSPARLAAYVRGCFDPAARLALAEVEARGEGITIGWDDAGPVAAQETALGYRHDSGFSRCYQVLAAEPLVADLVTALGAPMQAVPRKRISLHYRPGSLDLLPACTVLLTVTVDDEQAVGPAEDALVRAAAQTGIRLRPAAGGQAAFVVGLGIGIAPVDRPAGRPSWSRGKPFEPTSPWSLPGRLPARGVPVGRHSIGRGVVCFDPATWFRAGLVSSPDALVLASPGMGKTALVTRWAVGLAAFGYRVEIPGDATGEYVAATLGLAGVVRSVRWSGGASLNPCDPGGLGAVAAAIGGRIGAELAARAVDRAALTLHALVRMLRDGRPVADHERAALLVALRLLHARGTAPTLPDLVRVLAEGPDEVRSVFQWCTPAPHRRDDAHQTHLAPLLRALLTLLMTSFGEVFSAAAGPGDLDAPVITVDSSEIAAADPVRRAAVLVAARSEAYGRIEAIRGLAQAGLAPARRHVVVLDEPWPMTYATSALLSSLEIAATAERADDVCRITVRDRPQHLPDLVGSMVLGGLARPEAERLGDIVPLTDVELDLLGSWSRSGRGTFLIKPGAIGPGIPVDLTLTSRELAWQRKAASARQACTHESVK